MGKGKLILRPSYATTPLQAARGANGLAFLPRNLARTPISSHRKGEYQGRGPSLAVVTTGLDAERVAMGLHGRLELKGKNYDNDDNHRKHEIVP